MFEGKQSKLEDKLHVDGDLLSKLEQYSVITNYQRRQIDVTLFASFIIIRSHKRTVSSL